MTRWTCTECWAEGRTDAPHECPDCHVVGSTWETDDADDDPRRMPLIFWDIRRDAESNTHH